MKLSVVVAGAMLAAMTIVPTAAAHAAVAVTETYDYYGSDAAFFHFTNTGSTAITGFSATGGTSGTIFTGLTIAPGMTVDFLLGDVEANFPGSQGSVNVSYMSNGQTFSNTFTDVLGDPDVTVGPTSVGPSGAVPEPSSWLMMLAGFGMLGFALRRKPSSHMNAVTA